jgi:hypothetical protein
MQDWIIFLLGLVLAIPLSIFGNVLTRKYDEIISKRAISVRGQKLNALVNEYKDIRLLVSDQSRLILTASLWIMAGLSSLFIVSLAFWSSSLIVVAIFSRGEKTSLLARILAIVLVYLVGLVMTYFFRRLQKRWRSLIRAIYFNQYRANVIEQIKKLGGNPEDLDKEETEGG